MPFHWKSCLAWVLYLPLLSFSHPLSLETFDEQLTVRALRDGKIVSTFSFSTVLEGATPKNPRNLTTEDGSQHYTLFPLTLGQILREYAVTELHLTLNAGQWNYDSWGYPEEPDVGTGAELWAWMGEGGIATVDGRWRGPRNALAGLFCGRPPHDLTGGLPEWPGVRHAIRHASLPSENVCTENLTPFLKLLPCKSLSGIASLLNPHRLFDADWHGMGLDVLWLPDEGVQVRLTFQSVTDPLRPPSDRQADWSFASIFDRTIERRCPSATSNRVVVALPINDAYSIHPEPASIAEGHAIFNVAEQDVPLDVSMQWAESFQHIPTRPGASEAPLSIQRTLHGSSQDRGQLSVSITNTGPAAVQAAYLETMPWIVQFYLHTLVLRVDGLPRPDLLHNISYTPPVTHARATTLQAVLTLPARSTLHLRIDVAKAFLRYTEHPPDPQRGWDLPPAVLVVLAAGETPELTLKPGQRIYTLSLLVDLATPDFSMPYNVIIFSCFLAAFIFGRVFNLLSRKFVVLQVESN
ncbi:Gpi16 subunit GPI transamidase component [Mycena vulgaris]|nr:Gpi16 subunit GPI transamidase component [Mycena vulgaris]